jgi:hypothetical protein
LKAFRRLELAEIDGDILVSANEAKIGYDIERLQRLQMTRQLKTIIGLLSKKTKKRNRN